MMSNLLLLFILANFIKSAMDEKAKSQRFVMYRYDEYRKVYFHDLYFSLLTTLGLILGFVSSYMLDSHEFFMTVCNAALAVLLVKLHSYKKALSSKIMYLLQFLFISIPIKEYNQSMYAPVNEYAIYGILLYLIPEPLKYLKLFLRALRKKKNQKIWFIIYDVVEFLQESMAMLFGGLFGAMYCFYYLQSHNTFYAKILVFVIFLLKGLVTLLNKIFSLDNPREKILKYLSPE